MTIISAGGAARRPVSSTTTTARGAAASNLDARSQPRVALKALPALVRRLRLIAKHSEFVDDLDSLLDDMGSFKVISFYNHHYSTRLRTLIS